MDIGSLISDAECELEEANESGDLEDRMDAAFRLADLKAHRERLAPQRDEC